MTIAREILWQPEAKDIEQSRLHAFRKWLKAHKNIDAGEYELMWQWSVDHADQFWLALTEFFQVKFHSPFQTVMSKDLMPGTKWFEGATLNYAEHIFLGMRGRDTAIVFVSERTAPRNISVDEMWSEVAKFQAYFLAQGIEPGDRIAGFLPNIPEATYAFLATVSLGAIWSCCSPDFGVSSVVDRFQQIEPKLFIAADGYYYNGKVHNRQDQVEAIQNALPTLKDTLIIRYVHAEEELFEKKVTYSDQLPDASAASARFVPVPFEHPLWVLYSSGTTGAPKAITHSHGGCLLEHLKYLAFHNDVHAGEHFFWYTTTGWMMWNFLQGSMLHGATIILYDGSPGYPDLNRLWQLTEELPIHHFGTSAPFLVACMKEGIQPGQDFRFNSIKKHRFHGFAITTRSIHLGVSIDP